jgi:hypothetical protein
MNDKLYITIRVNISDCFYSFDAEQTGGAEAEIHLPCLGLRHLNLGDLFQTVLAAAVEDFDAVEEEEADNE